MVLRDTLTQASVLITANKPIRLRKNQQVDIDPELLSSARLVLKHLKLECWNAETVENLNLEWRNT